MLDAMLGNSPNVESVGELVSGMGRYDERCSCGATFRDCRYWSEVRDRFSRDGPHWDDAVGLFKGQAHIKAIVPTLLSSSRTAWVSRLTEYTRRMGVAIVQTAAVERSLEAVPQFLVDSSKEITRALFFARFVPDARIIHLMRHPVSILQSDYYRLKNGTGFKFLRMRFKPKRFFGPFLLVSILTWIIGNVLSDITRGVARSRFIRVRYESIIAEPVAEIIRIEQFLGTSLEPVKARLRTGDSFEVGHNIGGNHMRMAGVFRFDPKKSARTGLPFRFALMAWLMTWPLLIAYGYGGRMFSEKKGVA